MTTLTIAAIWIALSIAAGIIAGRWLKSCARTPSICERGDERHGRRKAQGSWRSVGARRFEGEIIQHGKGI